MEYDDGHFSRAGTTARPRYPRMRDIPVLPESKESGEPLHNTETCFKAYCIGNEDVDARVLVAYVNSISYFGRLLSSIVL